MNNVVIRAANAGINFLMMKYCFYGASNTNQLQIGGYRFKVFGGIVPSKAIRPEAIERLNIYRSQIIEAVKNRGPEIILGDNGVIIDVTEQTKDNVPTTEEVGLALIKGIPKVKWKNINGLPKSVKEFAVGPIDLAIASIRIPFQSNLQNVLELYFFYHDLTIGKASLIVNIHNKNDIEGMIWQEYPPSLSVQNRTLKVIEKTNENPPAKIYPVQFHGVVDSLYELAQLLAVPSYTNRLGSLYWPAG